MARKQTRRSISVNRQAYAKAHAYCEARDIPVAAFTEAALRLAMDHPEEWPVKEAKRLRDGKKPEETPVQPKGEGTGIYSRPLLPAPTGRQVFKDKPEVRELEVEELRSEFGRLGERIILEGPDDVESTDLWADSTEELMEKRTAWLAERNFRE